MTCLIYCTAGQHAFLYELHEKYISARKCHRNFHHELPKLAKQASTDLLIKSGPLSHFWTRNLTRSLCLLEGEERKKKLAEL
jgi:hypothetical protein